MYSQLRKKRRGGKGASIYLTIAWASANEDSTEVQIGTEISVILACMLFTTPIFPQISHSLEKNFALSGLSKSLTFRDGSS